MPPVPIRLKAKYTQGYRVKSQRHGGDRTGKAKRKKLVAAAKRDLKPQPIRVRLLKDGRVRMITVDKSELSTRR
jgi:hypothetical protein